MRSQDLLRRLILHPRASGRVLLLLAAVSLAGFSLAGFSLAGSPASAQDAPAPASDRSARPNFVVLLIDDAAFSDLGSYGGEARTPHIDALAARGTRFSRYYTSPLCAPSRAMLLTGIDNHRTGVATIPEVLPAEHRGQPGYAMRLEPGVTTVATRLKETGYRTYMTGKWHLGHGKGDLPADHGFDRSFILDASGADNWEDRPYMPYYDRADWFEGRERATLPEDFYSSRFMVDKMIDYLGRDDPDTPFLAYIGFQAIHIPIQAPREFTQNYVETYRDGWEALKRRRWERAKALGLIPQDAPLSTMPPGLRDWDDLSEEEKAFFAKSMAVNAGMLEAMDHHIGRLVAHLKSTGQYDNTVFIITSDNGPEPSDPTASATMRFWLWQQGYNRDIETLGEEGSYAFIGTEWAVAAATPGSLFKFYATEGGVRVPLIVSGPGIGATLTPAKAFVTDITPTILELAGAPDAGNGERVAMTGRSLLPVLLGTRDRVYAPDDAVGIEVSGNAALYRGDYKLTRSIPPWGDGSWTLHDTLNDPGETRDLSAELPQLRDQMLADYQAYAQTMGVLEVPKGYEHHKQLLHNSIRKTLQQYWWLVAGLGLLLLLIVWFAVRGLVRRIARGGPRA